jgi:hypothetical protein
MTERDPVPAPPAETLIARLKQGADALDSCLRGAVDCSFCGARGRDAHDDDCAVISMREAADRLRAEPPPVPPATDRIALLLEARLQNAENERIAARFQLREAKAALQTAERTIQQLREQAQLYLDQREMALAAKRESVAQLQTAEQARAEATVFVNQLTISEGAAIERACAAEATLTQIQALSATWGAAIGTNAALTLRNHHRDAMENCKRELDRLLAAPPENTTEP